MIRTLKRRLRGLSAPRPGEAELDDEVRFHIEMETEANLRAGMDPAEARRRALVAFGGVEGVKEELRDVHRSRALAELGRDLRFGLRTLRRSPGFTFVTVLTLALGIGATTAVFSLVDGVLLRALPYAEAGRLYTIYEETPAGAGRAPSHPAFQDWRAQARSFSSLAFVRGDDLTLRSERGPQILMAAWVSGSFFGTLGTPAMLGRTFGEVRPGEERVVVLSHHVWREQLGGDLGVVGRTVATTEGPMTVVGVMPPGFRQPFFADAWAPLAALPATKTGFRDNRALHADVWTFGRLAPGVTAERARAEMEAVAARLAAAYPAEHGEWRRIVLAGLREQVLGEGVRARLATLAAAVVLVLAVACVNVAGLMLARATARRREIAVRAALGAGRGRLVRQLLAESALLALAGGALGLLLAAGVLAALRRLGPAAMPRLDEVALDGRVLAFAVALSCGTALACGLVPALRASSPDLVRGLKAGTAGAGEARSTARLRQALVVAEVALALVLVAGAGLLAKSLGRLRATDPGFDPVNVVTVRVVPPARYAEEAAARELYRRLREALAAVPGVESAAISNHVPLLGGSMTSRVVGGRGVPAGGDRALFRTVSPEYFAAMRTRVLRGRALEAADLAGPGGVVINEALARAWWPGEDPVGRPITVFKASQARAGLGEPIAAQVAGVVEDERYYDLAGDPPPQVYVPYTWNPWGHVALVVRTAGDAEAMIPALRRAVLAVDPDLPVAGPGPVSDFRLMEEHLARSVEGERLGVALLAAFGAAAFVLAAVGVFGVMAYLVAQRTRELGLRMALGAAPADVLWLVARQTLGLAGLGIALGLAGAVAASGVLRSQLHGVSATDPATLAAAAAAFAAAALVAGLLPARRAARLAPTAALRVE